MLKKALARFKKSVQTSSSDESLVTENYYQSLNEPLINLSTETQATQTEGVEDRTIEYVATDSPNFEFRIKVRAEAHKAVLKFVKLNPHASSLQKLNENAGYDLTSVYNYLIPARTNAVIATGIAIEIPVHTYARIAPRSGLALKHSLDIGAGVIDSGYRGEIGVVVFNHGDTAYPVKKGDRIAQLLIIKLEPVDIEEVQILNPSNRGFKGFGSSGY